MARNLDRGRRPRINSQGGRPVSHAKRQDTKLDDGKNKVIRNVVVQTSESCFTSNAKSSYSYDVEQITKSFKDRHLNPNIKSVGVQVELIGVRSSQKFDSEEKNSQRKHRPPTLVQKCFQRNSQDQNKKKEADRQINENPTDSQVNTQESATGDGGASFLKLRARGDLPSDEESDLSMTQNNYLLIPNKGKEERRLTVRRRLDGRTLPGVYESMVKKAKPEELVEEENYIYAAPIIPRRTFPECFSNQSLVKDDDTGKLKSLTDTHFIENRTSLFEMDLETGPRKERLVDAKSLFKDITVRSDTSLFVDKIVRLPWPMKRPTLEPLTIKPNQTEPIVLTSLISVPPRGRSPTRKPSISGVSDTSGQGSFTKRKPTPGRSPPPGCTSSFSKGLRSSRDFRLVSASRSPSPKNSAFTTSQFSNRGNRFSFWGPPYGTNDQDNVNQLVSLYKAKEPDASYEQTTGTNPSLSLKPGKIESFHRDLSKVKTAKMVNSIHRALIKYNENPVHSEKPSDTEVPFQRSKIFVTREPAEDEDPSESIRPVSPYKKRSRSRSKEAKSDKREKKIVKTSRSHFKPVVYEFEETRTRSANNPPNFDNHEASVPSDSQPVEKDVAKKDACTSCRSLGVNPSSRPSVTFQLPDLLNHNEDQFELNNDVNHSLHGVNAHSEHDKKDDGDDGDKGKPSWVPGSLWKLPHRETIPKEQKHHNGHTSRLLRQENSNCCRITPVEISKNEMKKLHKRSERKHARHEFGNEHKSRKTREASTGSRTPKMTEPYQYSAPKLDVLSTNNDHLSKNQSTVDHDLPSDHDSKSMFSSPHLKSPREQSSVWTQEKWKQNVEEVRRLLAETEKPLSLCKYSNCQKSDRGCVKKKETCEQKDTIKKSSSDSHYLKSKRNSKSPSEGENESKKENHARKSSCDEKRLSHVSYDSVTVRSKKNYFGKWKIGEEKPKIEVLKKSCCRPCATRKASSPSRRNQNTIENGTEKRIIEKLFGMELRISTPTDSPIDQRDTIKQGPRLLPPTVDQLLRLGVIPVPIQQNTIYKPYIGHLDEKKISRGKHPDVRNCSKGRHGHVQHKHIHQQAQPTTKQLSFEEALVQAKVKRREKIRSLAAKKASKSDVVSEVLPMKMERLSAVSDNFVLKLKRRDRLKKS